MRLLCRVLEEVSTGILLHAIIHLKVAVGSGALGVNYTLRDSLAVKVRQLLNKMYVLQ